MFDVLDHIRLIIANDDRSPSTFSYLEKHVQVTDKVPITHAPLGDIAQAALLYLKGQKSQASEPYQKYYIEVFENLKDEWKQEFRDPNTAVKR